MYGGVIGLHTCIPAAMKSTQTRENIINIKLGFLLISTRMMPEWQIQMNPFRMISLFCFALFLTVLQPFSLSLPLIFLQ